jgi:hypothetical protein
MSETKSHTHTEPQANYEQRRLLKCTNKLGPVSRDVHTEGVSDHSVAHVPRPALEPSSAIPADNVLQHQATAGPTVGPDSNAEARTILVEAVLLPKALIIRGRNGRNMKLITHDHACAAASLTALHRVVLVPRMP